MADTSNMDSEVPSTPATPSLSAESVPSTTATQSVPASAQASGITTSAASTTATATATSGGRDHSKTVIYVSGIPSSIAEPEAHDHFVSTSPSTPIKSFKILHDKNRPGFLYAFVEFSNPEDAATALPLFTNTTLGGFTLNVSMAFHTQQYSSSNNSNGEDGSNSDSGNQSPVFNLFIGDLSLEINDDSLNSAFSSFPSLIHANVMWDMKTGRSRGYGFVSFSDRLDAENALNKMNGFTLGDRPIRLNWASHKEKNRSNNHSNNFGSFNQNNSQYNNQFNNNRFNNQFNNNGNNNSNNGMNSNNNNNNNNYNQYNKLNTPVMNGQSPLQSPNNSFDIVVRQTPNWLSVVYLGNLSEYTSQNDLIPLLQNFGFIVNFKLISEKNCAFVTYDTHERAALAIVQLSGLSINGRPLKCGWGKSNRNFVNRNNQQLPNQNQNQPQFQQQQQQNHHQQQAPQQQQQQQQAPQPQAIQQFTQPFNQFNQQFPQAFNQSFNQPFAQSNMQDL